jgi:hypothetical protein
MLGQTIQFAIANLKQLQHSLEPLARLFLHGLLYQLRKVALGRAAIQLKLESRRIRLQPLVE